MEALSKVLRKGVGEGQSVHQTTQYEKLAQEPSDEEAEDDDIVFLQDGQALYQNGFTKPSGNHKGNHCLIDGDAVKFGLIQKGSISKPKPSEMVQVKSVRCRMLMHRRIYWCLIVLLIALGLALVAVLAKPYYRKPPVPTKEWEKLFQGFGSESCIRLVDVDEDGKMDIIFSMNVNLNMSLMSLYNLSREDMKAVCTQQGENYPCLVALRGNDSHILWTTRIHSGLFELNCGKIDINKDGKMDCIGTGRLATVVAFDPRTGSVLWTADTATLVELWNAFNVLILPDFNGDQVPEVLLPHSSDPRFPPEVHDRYAGRLILLDGATGKSLGRYLNIPLGRETYMSPVLHTLRDGSQYILFGSGGETVPGSLLAISVPDFYRHAMSQDANTRVPNVSGKYNHWTFLPKVENQFVMELYRSETKGVMVPPVTVDVNGDGVRDILMLAFDGNLTLFEGESLKPIWSVTFSGMESYSSPAPGYFNNDDRLDFMLHLNHGSYPNYDYSMAVIVDGRTGETIWAFNSTGFEMTSALVARTAKDYHDFFIFRVKDCLDSSKLNRKRRSYQTDFTGEESLSKSPISQGSRRRSKPTYRSNGRVSDRFTGNRGDIGQPRRGSSDDYPGSDPGEINWRNGAPVQNDFDGDYSLRNGDDETENQWADSEEQNSYNNNYDTEPRSHHPPASKTRTGSVRKGSIYRNSGDREQRIHDGPASSNEHWPSSVSTNSPTTLLPKPPPLVATITGCSRDLSNRSVEVFLLDRITASSPLKIYQHSSQPLKYS